MMMRKIVAAVAISAATLICVVLAADSMLEIRWRRDLASQGEGRFLGTTAETLDRNLRDAIAKGSQRVTAEAALSKIELRFSYDVRSHTLFSGARVLKGSNWLVQSGVSIQLHFDSNDRLSTIESHAVNTGP